MEKIISPEERVRRAEEIYYRRRANNNIRMSSSQVRENKEKMQFSLYKKLALQILICILIYLIFSLIKEANYLFSENVIGKTKEFLNKDINFGEISSNVEKFLNDNQDKFSFLNGWTNEENSENVEQNQINENKTQTNTNQTTEQTNANEVNENQTEKNNQQEQNEQSNSNGIGGNKDDSQTENSEVVATSSGSSTSKTQMELDAQYIKENFELQLPVKGVVTSNYGKREPTEIVSANHQGIDIGINTGTTIVAAMAGKVTVVSDKGDYGTHVKIVNQNITTIYAHCSKILVKEGEQIKKGQKIALSGSTGKSTGPHLHFEIRRGTRTVDPALILKWE